MQGGMMLLVMLALCFEICTPKMEKFCKFRQDSKHNGTDLIDCSNQHWKIIPLNFSRFTTFNLTIDLSNNNITRVKNYSFKFVLNLLYLDLKNNQIEYIEAMAFDGCEKLRRLDLSGNILKMTHLPSSVFNMLVNLQWLNIKQNKIQNTCFDQERLLKNLISLETLNIDAFDEPKFREVGGFKNLRNLNLSEYYPNCQMKTLQNSTFRSFSNSSLQVLDISGCYLTTFETGVFEPLTNLRELHMEKTSVGMTNALRSLSSFSGFKMDVLDISGVHTKPFKSALAVLEDAVLYRKDLKYFGNICVKKLIIKKNNLLYIETMSLANSMFSACVKYIDASYNRLYGDPMGYAFGFETYSQLEYIDVSHQDRVVDIVFTPAFRENDEVNSSISHWQKSHVSLPFHQGVTLRIPKAIRHINASSMRGFLGEIKQNITLTNGDLLFELNMSFIGLNNISSQIKGLDNLTILDLSGNPYMSLIDSFFDTFSSIEALHLNHFSFHQEMVLQQGKRLLQPLTRLTCLYMSNNRLWELPANLFDENPLLQYLDLSKNIFASFPLDPQLFPRLQTLDMTLNTLGFLDRTSRTNLDLHAEMIHINFQLSLKGNHFICGCGSLDFIIWLKYTKIKLDNDGNYTCLLENGETSQLKNIPLLWRKCIGVTLFYISSSLLIIFVASLLCVLLVKTNKTTLINMVMKVLHKGISKPKRGDFRLDVYISYAEADYQYACHWLCPELEKRNLSMFIWDRDSIPGDSIPDQIAEVIPQCWKILLYFTDNFEKDPWMFMSMMAAINSVDNNNPEKIILLLPEEERPRIPNCLLDVVPESCIIRVKNAENDEQWENIAALIRRDE